MSDTTSRGIQYPTSGDIVRTGVAGEAKLAQDLQVMAATTNTAIDEVEGRFVPQVLSGSTIDVNTLTNNRPYILSNSNTVTNAPRSGVNALLRVGWTTSSGAGVVQTWEDLQTDYAIYRRRSTNSGTTWTDWVQVTDMAVVHSSGTVDLDVFIDRDGRHVLRNNITVTNAPRSGVNALLTIDWLTATGLGLAQTWQDIQTDYAVFRRRSIDRGSTWTDWVQINGTASSSTGAPWTRTDPVYFWGDSSVAGGGADGPWDEGENLPGQLNDILSVPVIDRGEGGRTSNQILVRAGSILLHATPAGGSIPSAGNVALDLGGQIIGGWDSNSWVGYFAGIYGTLYQTSTGFSFTRSSSGTAVPVPDPAEFVPADRIDGTGTHIFLMAGNDWLTTNPHLPEPDKATHVIANYLRAIESVPGPTRHVIIGGVKTRRDTEIGDANHEFVQHVNTELARLVPQHFVSRQDWLVNNALDALGLEPTTEDLDHIAAGIIPKRAFSDVTHIRREIMPHEAAELWGPTLQQRGWA